MLMLTRSCLFAVILSKHYSKAQWPMQVEYICDGLRNAANIKGSLATVYMD